MSMRFLQPIGALLVLLWLGCSREHSSHPGSGDHPEEPHHEEGAHYEEGKGIVLGPEARDAMGITTEPARERTLALGFSGRARVFHAAHQHAMDFPGQKDGFAYAIVMVPAERAEFLKVNQSVELTTAQARKPIMGRIARLNRETARAVGQIEVVVEFPDPDEQFEFGSVLQAQFEGSKRRALVIPRPALVEAATGTFVYQIVDGHYLRSPVTTGGENEEFVEVVEGIEAGVPVVTIGAVDLWLTELRLTRGGGHAH